MTETRSRFSQAGVARPPQGEQIDASRGHLEQSEEGRDAPAHRGLFIALLLLLAWVPWPLGSNRPWSWALLEAGALGLFCVWLVVWTRDPFPVSAGLRTARAPLAMMGLGLVYMLLQSLPLPPAVLDALNPAVSDHYQAAARAVAVDSVALSIDRGASLVEALKVSAYLALLFIVLAVVNTRSRLHTLCVTLFAVGFCESLYGLAVFLSQGTLGLWDPRWSAGTVAGTYVNGNHFAGLLEMTIALGLGLGLQGSGRQSAGDWRTRMRSLPRRLLDTRAWYFFALLVMTGALILSASRGAMGALAASLFGVVLLSLGLRGRRTRAVRTAPQMALVVLAAGLWLGVGATKDKLLESGLQSNRPDVRSVVYPMIREAPVFGTGAGTFRWSFSGFKDERFGVGIYEHAHNDYLELFAEQGFVGFALFSASILVFLLRIAAGYRERRDPLMLGILFGVLVGVSSLLIHGLVDFNFHIPANAAYFFVLLGIGVNAACIDKRPSDPESREECKREK